LIFVRDDRAEHAQDSPQLIFPVSAVGLVDRMPQPTDGRFIHNSNRVTLIHLPTKNGSFQTISPYNGGRRNPSCSTGTSRTLRDSWTTPVDLRRGAVEWVTRQERMNGTALERF